MKLLVIVLCLLSERYLVHALSFKRFDWYRKYWDLIKAKMPQTPIFKNPYVMTAVAVLPILILTACILWLFCSFLFGFIYLLLSIVIFYYCIGPTNPFYPVKTSKSAKSDLKDAEHYFAEVNGQIFAIIFWYILLGPLAVLTYRLISLCAEQTAMSKPLKSVVDSLDWIPARITVLLYLLVGNFQQGLTFFAQNLFALPEKNEYLLSHTGVLAASVNDKEDVPLPVAQTLVEHSMIVYMVFLAFFTLVSWL